MNSEEEISLINYPVYRNIPYNKTSFYLIPSLNLGYDSKLLREMGFINAYLKWEDCIEQHKDCLFLLLNPRPSVMKEHWATYEEVYTRIKSFVCSYDVEIGLIILVFKIAGEYKHLPKLLITGKYSQFPHEYCRKNFRKRDSILSEYKEMPQYHVIMKSPSRKVYLEEITGEEIDISMEYDSIPDLENEYFNLDRFKAQYGQ